MNRQPPKLLSRDQFREGVLRRDGHRCVFCGRGAGDGVKLDAHHIMERRLWWAPHQYGGYYLENGATCCDTDFNLTDKPVSVHGRPLRDYSCHLLCGMTILSPDDCRKAAGIDVVWLPEHLYGDYALTLWGDPIDEDGNRSRGELFYDESVQLMLKMGGVLPLYTKYVRHFRTLHFPFSPKAVSGNLGDDRVISDMSRFASEPMVVTGKMDGGQSHWYDD